MEEQFLDIETPTLFRRTPGGAKEFVVPTRIKVAHSPRHDSYVLMWVPMKRTFNFKIAHGSKNRVYPTYLRILGMKGGWGLGLGSVRKP